MSKGATVPDVSAVIVNHNGGHLLATCIQALHAAADPLRLEIIVVDNSSTDGSLDTLHGASAPDRVLRLQQNLGFARANNLGLQYARGPFYLLVNTDCFVRPGMLTTLLGRLATNSSVGIVGPRLLNADGSLQPSCHDFPTPIVIFLEQSLLWHVFRTKGGRGWSPAIASSHIHTAHTDWISGACLLVRAETWLAVGGFDPRFFFYWEEADLCWRIQQQGWRVLFDPTAEAVHLGGGSSHSPVLRGQFFRSLYLFYAKHYPPRWLAVTRLIVAGMALFKAGRAAWRGARSARNTDPTGARAAQAEWRGWLEVIRL